MCAVCRSECLQEQFVYDEYDKYNESVCLAHDYEKYVKEVHYLKYNDENCAQYMMIFKARKERKTGCLKVAYTKSEDLNNYGRFRSVRS